MHLYKVQGWYTISCSAGIVYHPRRVRDMPFESRAMKAARSSLHAWLTANQIVYSKCAVVRLACSVHQPSEEAFSLSGAPRPDISAGISETDKHFRSKLTYRLSSRPRRAFPRRWKGFLDSGEWVYATIPGQVGHRSRGDSSEPVIVFSGHSCVT